MRNTVKFGMFPVLFMLIVFVFAVACGKKNVKRTPAPEPSRTAFEPAFSIEDVTASEGEGSLRNKDYSPEAGVFTVFFNYDKAELSEEALKSLQANAATLKKRAAVEIQVAGHCDERGTTEYNLALGQRRANIVRNYYKHHGIKMNSMSTISYGEEKPVCVEAAEGCWAQNRRVETLIRTK